MPHLIKVADATKPFALLSPANNTAYLPRLKYDLRFHFDNKKSLCEMVERYYQTHYAIVPCDQLHKITPLQADTEAMRQIRQLIISGEYSAALHDSGAIELIANDDGERETLAFRNGRHIGSFVEGSLILDRDSSVKAIRA